MSIEAAPHGLTLSADIVCRHFYFIFVDRNVGPVRVSRMTTLSADIVCRYFDFIYVDRNVSPYVCHG